MWILRQGKCLKGEMGAITFKPLRVLVTASVTIFLVCTVLIMLTLNEYNSGVKKRSVVVSERSRDLNHRKPDEATIGVNFLKDEFNEIDKLKKEKDQIDPSRPSKHSQKLKANQAILRSMQRKMLTSANRPPDSSYNINVTLSDVTPLDRKVIDSRPSECREINYDIKSLPTASIVIPFHNEAFSMLLRTVHSILNNAPDELLADVILVDDHSAYSYLQEDLVEYVRFLPKVKVIRTPERVGLIRARLLGVEEAHGEVVMFQDAHTECNVGWLEPILSEIKRNPRAVVQPHIDRVDPQTIEYNNDMEWYPIGAFGWDLRYAWLAVPIHEHRRTKSKPSAAVRSPTLVGCALAVNKKNFLATGSFDTGLKIWGGENLELSFRTWMCGGEVLTAPCSRVAHVFKVQTYGFEGEKAKVVKRNSMRVAEVWLDDFKRFFYATTSGTFVPLKDAGIESIEERKQLRKSMKCHDFQWYLDNVFPDLQTPSDDAILYGDLTNSHSKICLKPDEKSGYVVFSAECYTFRIMPAFEFYIDTNFRFRYRDKCIDFGDNLLLKMINCKDIFPMRTWSLRTSGNSKRTGQIVATTKVDGALNTYCLNHVTNVIEPFKGEQMPQMNECRTESRFQTWYFMYSMDQSTLKEYRP